MFYNNAMVEHINEKQFTFLYVFSLLLLLDPLTLFSLADDIWTNKEFKVSITIP